MQIDFFIFVCRVSRVVCRVCVASTQATVLLCASIHLFVNTLDRLSWTPQGEAAAGPRARSHRFFDVSRFPFLDSSGVSS